MKFLKIQFLSGTGHFSSVHSHMWLVVTAWGRADKWHLWQSQKDGWDGPHPENSLGAKRPFLLCSQLLRSSHLCGDEGNSVSWYLRIFWVPSIYVKCGYHKSVTQLKGSQIWENLRFFSGSPPWAFIPLNSERHVERFPLYLLRLHCTLSAFPDRAAALPLWDSARVSHFWWQRITETLKIHLCF